MKFRKKPIVIEAVRADDLLVPLSTNSVSAQTEAHGRAPIWLREALADGRVQVAPNGLLITTLEGAMIAGFGDWIIRGVRGELYPCKPDIFEATYEKVIDQDS